MNKILIKRKIGETGVACKMICYIDNQEICRIKEEESYIYETDKESCEFKCQLTLGNPMSETYKIDFSNSNGVQILAKQGFWKPKAVIKYENTETQSINKEIEKIENLQKFTSTKKVAGILYIDESKKLWAIPQGIFNNKIKEVHEYSDILSYEIVEDGNSISKGGVGRAIVGGLLFGGVGAIVGGVTGHKSKATCTKLEVIIKLNSMSKPLEKITLISTETRKDNLLYSAAIKRAQEIAAILEIMCNGNNKIDVQPSVQQISGADEILKYKSLLDQGIITEEEFEAKKKQILNL